MNQPVGHIVSTSTNEKPPSIWVWNARLNIRCVRATAPAECERLAAAGAHVVGLGEEELGLGLSDELHAGGGHHIILSLSGSGGRGSPWWSASTRSRMTSASSSGPTPKPEPSVEIPPIAV